MFIVACHGAAHLPGVYDERDVAVLDGGEAPEPADHGVLLEEAVHAALAGPHHELQVIQHHVANVVHVRRVRHRLSGGTQRH